MAMKMFHLRILPRYFLIVWILIRISPMVAFVSNLGVSRDLKSLPPLNFRHKINSKHHIIFPTLHSKLFSSRSNVQWKLFSTNLGKSSEKEEMKTMKAIVPSTNESPLNITKGQVSMFVKVSLLSLLVLQNAGTSLLSVHVRDHTYYDGASVAFAQELGKIPLILGMFSMLRGQNSTETYASVMKETFSLRAFDLAPPAMCFAIQNVLYFTALSHIDAATYSVLSQSKTAFTAFFFVTLLGQRLNPTQILALTILTAGMGLVQLTPNTDLITTSPISSVLGGVASSSMIGIGAALASSLFSGLATILFEKQAKRESGSLCAKQLQLVSWTTAFTGIEILRRGGFNALFTRSLFQGWTPAVWAIVFLKTTGGMLTATSIRLTDNMVKTFATAAAIVITTIASPPSVMERGKGFITGVLMVLSSAFLYASARK